MKTSCVELSYPCSAASRVSAVFAYLHGPSELGKDIVFDSVDEFGDPRVVACVVKNEKISGSASSGARVVITQAQQALDSEFTDEKGNPQFVDAVFIISPWEITPMAMESVKGAMGRGRGQIAFKCGHKLLELFAKHWPEFLVEESNLVGPYLTRLVTQVDQEGAVTNVLFRYGIIQSVQKRLSEVYVDPAMEIGIRRFFVNFQLPNMEILKTKVSAGQIDSFCASLENLAQLSSMFAILGFQDSRQQEWELRALRDKLVKAWEMKYQEYRKQREKEYKIVPPRTAVEFQLPEEGSITEVLEKPQRLFYTVCDAVQKANIFAQSQSSSASSLGSDAYQAFKTVEMFWRAMPRLIAAEKK